MQSNGATLKRPNILYIHSHDTGRYVQPYGHAIPTPNIQKFAEQGTLFRQAFCGAPTCSPSRACLLTGQNAHASGMLGLAHRGFTLKDYRQHLVQTLSQAGYASALIGVQHVAPSDQVEQIGYDEIVPLPDRMTPTVAGAAATWLASAPAKPFFLDVGFYATHRTFPEPDPPDDPRYCLPPAPLPDTPQTRYDMAAFKTLAHQLDDGVGQVLRALGEAHLAENTLVICTTDHGIAFPSMKCNLTDHGIGVMLIMRGPGGFTGGAVCDAMVSHLDIFPTLCDLLKISPPSWLEGTSLLPLIQGIAERIHEEIFAEVTFHAAYEPQRAVRTNRWKYIRRFIAQVSPVLPNCDDGPSKDLWLAHGWRDKGDSSEQLYDLLFDPCEMHNVASDPAAAVALADMRTRLDRWMRKTSDPLLTGPVPAPPDAIVNDARGLSPKEKPNIAR